MANQEKTDDYEDNVDPEPMGCVFFGCVALMAVVFDFYILWYLFRWLVEAQLS